MKMELSSGLYMALYIFKQVSLPVRHIFRFPVPETALDSMLHLTGVIR